MHIRDACINIYNAKHSGKFSEAQFKQIVRRKRVNSNVIISDKRVCMPIRSDSENRRRRTWNQGTIHIFSARQNL